MSKRKKSTSESPLAAFINRVARGGIYTLLVGMPFHAFVVVVLGFAFGSQLLFASWKEVVILGLTACALLKSLRDGWGWLHKPANWLVLVIAIFGMVGALLADRFDIATLAGIKTTFLPLLLFVAVQPFAGEIRWRRLRVLVIVPASIVALLAIMQFLIVPTTWLQAVGYSSTTITPYQGVFAGASMARSFATLGGPNQLGAYLILPIVWCVALAVTAKQRRHRLIAAGLSMGMILALATSFSRSALLGLIAGLVVLFGLFLPRIYQAWYAFATLLATVFGIGQIRALALQEGSIIQRFFIRGEVTDSGMILGSDEGHVFAWQNGLDVALRHPLGLGFGASGPASKYGANYSIAENWYVQILLELGWFGVVAFGLLLIELIRRWWLSNDRVSKVLLAGSVGILLANLFLHTYADSTLAILSWTLFGLSYGAGRERGHDGA
ncbi:O-antigen ligase domain-containing protein [Patescibacteria group bacterium]|nr:MAG: O-antigen ligase domain-containing protein [Patescibacteria group bacterium]